MIRRIALSWIAVSGAMLVGGCVQQPERYGYGAPPPAPVAPVAPPALVAAKAPPPETSLLALMPLNLPLHEQWSSPRCPDLAVTFSGRSEPAHSVPSDTASFQEARQYHEADYYEVAECFCSKAGDLSETTKAAADAVMAQTAQQFSDSAHMRIRSTSFVEKGPLGKYSEIEAVPLMGSSEVVTMLTYWRGQCSMRVETMSSPETNLRAAQFLSSLHMVKVAQTQKADAAPAPADASSDAAGTAKPAPETAPEAATAAAPATPTALPPGTVINPPPPAPATGAPPNRAP